MKKILFFLALSLPLFVWAQPATGDVKKYKIKKVREDEDGKYGQYVRTWYYNRWGDDSIYVNHNDTLKTILTYGIIGITKKIVKHDSGQEDVSEYEYKIDRSCKVTTTDGQFKFKNYEWYDGKKRLIKSQSPDGNVITYTYNPSGNLISMASNGNNDGIKVNRKYTYNAKGLLIKDESMFEGKTSVTIYTNDNKGLRIKSEETGQLFDDVLKNITLYEYDNKGLLTKRIFKTVYPDKPDEEKTTYTFQYTYEFY